MIFIKHVFFTFLFLSVLAPSAFAQSKTAKIDNAPAKIKVTAKPEIEDNQNTSISARDAKESRFGANILVTPLSDFTLQAGIEVVYNASSNWQFGLTSLSGREDISESAPKEKDVSVTIAKLSGNAAFTYFRWFNGNSFGFLGGLGYRKATIDYQVESNTTKDFIEGQADISSVIGVLGIGNRWSWENGFTIGCDWAVAMVPISGSAKTTTRGTLSNAQITDINDTFSELSKKLSNSTSLTLLLTSIGYVF